MFGTRHFSPSSVSSSFSILITTLPVSILSEEQRNKIVYLCSVFMLYFLSIMRCLEEFREFKAQLESVDMLAKIRQEIKYF